MVAATYSRNKGGQAAPAGSDSDSDSGAGPSGGNGAAAANDAFKGINLEGQKEKEVLHHVMVQTILSRKRFTQKQIEGAFQLACKIAKTKSVSLGSFIDSLHDSLDKAGLELVHTLDPVTGEPYYILTNQDDDEVAKLATDYKPEQIALLRILIDRIMTAGQDAYCISMMDALNSLDDEAIFPVIKKKEGQKIIKSFVARGWLNLSPASRLTLSARLIEELSQYLKATFRDDDPEADPLDSAYRECEQCGKMVVAGYSCPGEDCPTMVHKNCTLAFLVGGACKKCNETWPVTVEEKNKRVPYGEPVGEAIFEGRAAPEADYSEGDDDDAAPASKKKKPAPKKKKATQGSRKSGREGRKSIKIDSDESDELSD